jgi:hypothetical protein
MQRCYLCGVPIAINEMSGDHVIPKTLIERRQPRVKGFDYAGKLPSHQACNNRFGPEVYVDKALALLAALYDQSCSFEYRHPENPALTMLALNSACLPDFARRDLVYFKIIDARPLATAEMHDLKLLEHRQPVNPKRHALETALAVLTKSAAALLLSRKLRAIPNHWQVLAVPYVAHHVAPDFDDILGKTEPFDIGVKVWVGYLETDDFLVVYRVKRVIVHFLFQFSTSAEAYDRMLSQFDDGNRFLFRGGRLMELIDYRWLDV